MTRPTSRTGRAALWCGRARAHRVWPVTSRGGDATIVRPSCRLGVGRAFPTGDGPFSGTREVRFELSNRPNVAEVPSSDFRSTCILVSRHRALSACGGDDSPATAEPPPIVAALGDSITAGATGWSPQPELRAVIASRGELTRSSQWEYWAGQATDGAFRFRNCGVEGDRTDEIEAAVRGLHGRRRRRRHPGRYQRPSPEPDDRSRRRRHPRHARAGKGAGLRALVTTAPPINGRVSGMGTPSSERLNALIRSIAQPTRTFWSSISSEQLEDPADPVGMPARWTATESIPRSGLCRIGDGGDARSESTRTFARTAVSRRWSAACQVPASRSWIRDDALRVLLGSLDDRLWHPSAARRHTVFPATKPGACALARRCRSEESTRCFEFVDGHVHEARPAWPPPVFELRRGLSARQP